MFRKILFSCFVFSFFEIKIISKNFQIFYPNLSKKSLVTENTPGKVLKNLKNFYLRRNEGSGSFFDYSLN